MKHALLFLTLAACLATALPVAAADCFADYKAKQDDPLRLHYGVAQVRGECTATAARAAEAKERAAASAEPARSFIFMGFLLGTWPAFSGGGLSPGNRRIAFPCRPSQPA